MQFDPLTIAAQIVNFLILIWLLRRFLYGPIMKAMHRREDRITQRLQEAAQGRKEAEQEGRTYRERLQELDEQRERLLEEARQAAEQERASRHEAIRAEAEERQRQWHRQLDAQRGEFLEELRQHSVRYVTTLARHALRDLADAKLEDQMVRVFLRRLDDLDDGERHRLTEAARHAGNEVVVTSRFEIESAGRGLITKAIHGIILDGAAVAYEHGAESVSGVELSAGGQTVGWNFESYLEDLDRQIGEELEESLDAARPGEKR